MAKSNTAKRVRIEDFFVSPEDRPGWVIANERLPGVGEEVYCVGGTGVIRAVLGKTSDGSRLLEIQLEDPQQTKPFFASAANVLVTPE